MIDAKEEVAGHLKPASEADISLEEMMGFSLDEFLFPDVDVLLRFTKEWLDLITDQRAAFYSAEERHSEEEQVEDVPETPAPGRKQKDAKPKRVTTATLAAQIAQVTDLIPNLVSQVTRLQKSQEEMQMRFITPQLPVPARGSQLPVSGQVAQFAKMVGVPPRTKAAQAPPPAASHQQQFQQPGVDTGMTPQEDAEEHSPQGDALARAMLEQSKALSNLVAQMQHGDPLLDQAASSAGTSLGSKVLWEGKSCRRSFLQEPEDST